MYMLQTREAIVPSSVDSLQTQNLQGPGTWSWYMVLVLGPGTRSWYRVLVQSVNRSWHKVVLGFFLKNPWQKPKEKQNLFLCCYLSLLTLVTNLGC